MHGGAIMKCWCCGADNASYTRNLETNYIEKVSYFEYSYKDAVKNEHQRCYCKE